MRNWHPCLVRKSIHVTFVKLITRIYFSCEHQYIYRLELSHYFEITCAVTLFSCILTAENIVCRTIQLSVNMAKKSASSTVLNRVLLKRLPVPTRRCPIFIVSRSIFRRGPSSRRLSTHATVPSKSIRRCRTLSGATLLHVTIVLVRCSRYAHTHVTFLNR